MSLEKPVIDTYKMNLQGKGDYLGAVRAFPFASVFHGHYVF